MLRYTQDDDGAEYGCRG